MYKSDARKLGKESQQLLRNQAINLLKRNVPCKKIAKTIGVHPSTIYMWLNLYKKLGEKGLVLKKRGVKLGTNSRLNSEQINILKDTLINKSPNEFDMPFLLWTRGSIQLLIFHYWQIFMPKRTIGDYLKRLNFTPQKPLRRAYEQNPKAVQRWLEQEYPSIVERAKNQKAQIHWVDETGLRSDDHYGRSYSPKGKTPVIRITAKRFKIGIISSVTNKGKVRFEIYQKAMNTQKLIEFVRQLIRDAKHKIFIILDNLAVHHSKIFNAWLDNKTDKIEVFHLPSYSPELNPDEYLNRDLKKSFYSGSPARNIKELKKHVSKFLKMLQKSPRRIKNYFKNVTIKYAA